MWRLRAPVGLSARWKLRIKNIPEGQNEGRTWCSSSWEASSRNTGAAGGCGQVKSHRRMARGGRGAQPARLQTHTHPVTGSQ